MREMNYSKYLSKDWIKKSLEKIQEIGESLIKNEENKYSFTQSWLDDLLNSIIKNQEHL